MNREEKAKVIQEVKDLFSSAQGAFLVNFKGLAVSDMQVLRRELREHKGKLKVVKTRLMKMAVKDVSGGNEFGKDFKDQVGLVFAQQDISPVAKNLVTFSRKHSALSIVSGFFESKMLTKEKVIFLASLPSKNVLIAQFAATLQAPIAGLARMLQQILDQRASE